ncbi:MAG: hypothetical protein H7839_07805 [Magnetococcus sp. YQC-5]
MNTPSKPVNLGYADPNWLAQSPVALSYILESVDTLPEWDEHTAGLLDYAYRVRLARLLRTHAEAEEFRELNQNILKVAHPIREQELNALDKPYAVRWLAFSDILEDRLSVLGLTVPDSVKQRRYVKEILEWILPQQEVAQQKLIDHFKIEEANLSRILTVMEGWELVVRHRRKKEKFVTLGPRAHEVLDGYDSMAIRSRADMEQEMAHFKQEMAQLKRTNQELLKHCKVSSTDTNKRPATRQRSQDLGIGQTVYFGIPAQ